MSESAFLNRSVSTPTTGHPPATAELIEKVNTVVNHVFRAGLALDALQRSAETEYGKARAAAAVAALDEALCELRNLGTALSAVNRR